MRKAFVVAAVAVVLPFSPAIAGGHGDTVPDGDAINALVSGNTVEGSMMEIGAYAGLCAADGTTHGDGSTGAWLIEGDTMCFIEATWPVQFGFLGIPIDHAFVNGDLVITNIEIGPNGRIRSPSDPDRCCARDRADQGSPGTP